MFHHFTFEWGYAEDQRICGGPTFHHAEGFTNPLDALESLRLVLYGLAKRNATVDPTVQRVLGDLVSSNHLDGLAASGILLRLREEAKPTSGMVVELFSNLWTMSNDDFGADGFEEALEEAGWSCYTPFRGEPRAEHSLTICQTERWLDEAPAYFEDVDWRDVEDPSRLPVILAFGGPGIPDFLTRKWKVWEQKVNGTKET